MELTHDFVVPAPVDAAWETFMDLERVGGCFPGATVTEALAKVNVRGLQAGAPELRINWWGVALAVYFVAASLTLAVHVLDLIKWVASKL